MFVEIEESRNEIKIYMFLFKCSLSCFSQKSCCTAIKNQFLQLQNRFDSHHTHTTETSGNAMNGDKSEIEKETADQFSTKDADIMPASGNVEQRDSNNEEGEWTSNPARFINPSFQGELLQQNDSNLTFEQSGQISKEDDTGVNSSVKTDGKGDVKVVNSSDRICEKAEDISNDSLECTEKGAGDIAVNSSDTTDQKAGDNVINASDNIADYSLDHTDEMAGDIAVNNTDHTTEKADDITVNSSNNIDEKASDNAVTCTDKTIEKAS